MQRLAIPCLLTALLIVPSLARAQSLMQIDGASLPQWATTGNDTALRYRPMASSDHAGALVVQNTQLTNVINQKAIYASSTDAATGATYGSMVFQNLDVGNVFRDASGQAAGLHMDFLYIEANNAGQPVKPNVLVDNVYLHDPAGTAADASAQPLWLVADNGSIGTAMIRNLTVENAGTANKIYAKWAGDSIDTVVIDSCPGQDFVLGGLGTIGQVIVQNSPGVLIDNGVGTTIVYDESSLPSGVDAMAAVSINRSFALNGVPEPASLGVLALAAIGLLRRARRMA